MSIYNEGSTMMVIQYIKDAIESGDYREKEILPSTYEIARELDVKTNQVRNAISILEEDNILINRPGVGVFVNAKPILSSGIEQLGSVTEMIQRSGKTPGVQYISAEITEPTDADRRRFDPLAINRLSQLERVRTADGEPVVYCIDRVDQEMMPLEIIHRQESIFQALETHAKKEIDFAVAYIEPIGYHEKISPILNCEPDEALLLLRQMHYTKDNEPILYSANFFRADVFSFYVLRKRLT